MEVFYEEQTFAIVSIGIFCVSFSSHPPLHPPQRAYCYIEYLNPEEVDRVEVTLEVEPTSGPAPLSVKFTSTAKAVIHYVDEIEDGSEGGSVDPREPLYRNEPVTPDKPDDQVIEKPGTYPFTATAKYGGKNGKATVTVEVQKSAEQEQEEKEDEFVDEAEDYLYTPFDLGGDDEEGIDCSGLIIASLEDMGYDVEDRTADGIYNDYVTPQECEEDDKGILLFYDWDGDGVMDHVAICEGTHPDPDDGTIVYERKHASSLGGEVIEDEDTRTPAGCGSINFDSFELLQ